MPGRRGSRTPTCVIVRRTAYQASFNRKRGTLMRPLLMSCLVLTTFASSVMPTVADDQADCTAGIAMIKAELDKKPPQTTLTALQRALRSAERELKEAEFDECVDAVDDAKKALGR